MTPREKQRVFRFVFRKVLVIFIIFMAFKAISTEHKKVQAEWDKAITMYQNKSDAEIRAEIRKNQRCPKTNEDIIDKLINSLE